MKRATVFLFAMLAFFLCACALEEPPVSPAPTAPARTAVPEEERFPVQSEGGAYLTGKAMTEEALSALSRALRAQGWGSLAGVLEAFSMRTDADVRRCDFTFGQNAAASLNVDGPHYAEGVAYIALRGEILCVLLFSEHEKGYMPRGVIVDGGVISEATAPLYELRTACRVESVGGTPFFFYEVYGGAPNTKLWESWYDCTSGKRLLAALLMGSWKEGGGKAALKTELSHEALEAEDGFALAVQESMTVSVPDEAGGTAADMAQVSYELRYDAAEQSFYAATDHDAALYEALAQSDAPGVAAWARESRAAQEKINVIAPPEGERVELDALEAPQNYAVNPMGSVEFTRERLEMLKFYVDARVGEGLFDALTKLGVYASSAVPELLWETVEEVSCTLDLSAAHVREAYLKIACSGGGSSGRGLLLVFTVRGGDAWGLARCIAWDAPYFEQPGAEPFLSYDLASQALSITYADPRDMPALLFFPRGRLEYLRYDEFSDVRIEYRRAENGGDAAGYFWIDAPREGVEGLVIPVFQAGGKPYLRARDAALLTRYGVRGAGG